MDAVVSALGLDVPGAAGDLVAVTERHGGDATFVACSLLRQCVCTGGAACLLLLRSSLGHQHNVGTKLGYNLRQLQAEGRVAVVEAFKGAAGRPGELDVLSGDKEGVAKALFLAVRDAVEQVLKVTSKVCVVVDDISDLLCLGVPVRHALTLVQYCRTLPVDFPSCRVVVCAHVAEDDEDQSVLATYLAHAADVSATVAGLKTGRSAQVSGTLAVRHKGRGDARQWNRQSLYHFRLHDRHVSLFAPGEVT